MPLIKSGSRAAVSENIAEMRHAGHPQAQAVAAALSNARKYGGKFAAGGPSGERYAQRQVQSQGFLHSSVPGRTDKLPITVGGGAYVLPADHLAAIGQGNSLAGKEIVNKMFKMGPYGMANGAIHSAKGPQPHLGLRAPPMAKAHGSRFKRGGESGGGDVDIIAAGGEFIIPREKIIEMFSAPGRSREEALEIGHGELDKWVKRTRKKHIKQLRELKPPKVN